MQPLPGVVLFLRSKKAKLIRYLDAHIVVALVSIFSPPGNLLNRLTTTYFQALPILLTAYTSFSLLPALLSACSSVIEDTHIYCLHVSHNCIRILLLIDVYLNIFTGDFMFFVFMCIFCVLFSFSLYYFSILYAFVIHY